MNITPAKHYYINIVSATYPVVDQTLKKKKFKNQSYIQEVLGLRHPQPTAFCHNVGTVYLELVSERMNMSSCGAQPVSQLHPTESVT